jgi:DNA-binding LacI/PurR family transcriptional regulator
MAHEAARLIIRLRNEPRRAVDRLDLATTLVVRGSTKRLG